MLTTRLGLAAAIFMSCMSWAQAIVNMDNLHFRSFQTGFSGAADLMLSGSSGNTENSLISLNSQMQWNTDTAINLLLIGSDYGKSSGERNVNKHFIHGRHIRRWLENIDYEFFAQVEKNEFTRLSRRSLLGAGYRFSFANGQATRVILGAGAFHSVEDIEPRTGLTDDATEKLTRGNFYLLSRHNINKQLKLSNVLYYQPDLSNTADYRLLYEGDISVKINESLDMKVSLDITHDSMPPQTIEETDASLKVGLQVNF
jgi:putative salt-induced outer membrane protein YdiY